MPHKLSTFNDLPCPSRLAKRIVSDSCISFSWHYYSVISLKKLLDTTSDEGALTLQAIALFLDITAQRAVDYDFAKQAAYQRGMR